MREKELLLQESLTKQKEMELNLSKLSRFDHQQKQEKEKLLKEKLMLEEKLQEYSKNIQECKNYINNLQQQSKEEKINRAT